MHEYEIKLLNGLKEKKGQSVSQLERSTGLSLDSILWAAENLSKSGAVVVERSAARSVSVTKEGEGYLKQFPEEEVVRLLEKSGGKSKVEALGNQIGILWAKKNGWITIEKGIAALTERGKQAANGEQYELREIFNSIYREQPKMSERAASMKGVVETLAKRNLITVDEKNVISSISITKEGLDALSGARVEKGVDALTRETIKSGVWEKQGFRPYNINAPGETVYPARLHPFREFSNFLRQKWLEMGFIEVSGPIVETAFWNFDALFSPQDHPTREMQDTFFLSNPESLTIEDLETLQKVRKMHIKGWKEQWNEEIASEAVLRTHTTSVSARYMRKLATTLNANYPLKLFSIGPVFRNENLDYKHLAELHQLDGIIVGDNLTLSNLIDTLKKFFSKLGMDDIKIHPQYFPFTEPSLEGLYYDEEHGDYIELFGGGIIRKEITKAMGTDKTVLAWGIGVDRFLLNKNILGVDSLPAVFKNNIGWLRSRRNLKV
ncbi:MAG: phenylalanine--tRNA ligase subunit alpha [Candidatus Micrarchaeales archaeon]|nr:phenylalanine--tRNA ligase subunit alpha [Candidatus Micrarchaeales archaeon]